MNIDHPNEPQIPALRHLWKQAFGDDDVFLDSFFRTAFSPARCRCLSVNDQVAAALYWFDCSYPHGKIAYIYAVATLPGFRGQGLCRKLIENTHGYLAQKGYAAAVLVPGEPSLLAMYEKMGYLSFSGMDTFAATPGSPVPLQEISAAEYAAHRSALLPEGGIRQENENLAFLCTFARLYAGDGFVFAAAESGDSLTVFELLGDRATAPGILAALKKSTGSFRIPGSKAFAMCHPLQDVPAPGYFGLAFD